LGSKQQREHKRAGEAVDVTASKGQGVNIEQAKQKKQEYLYIASSMK
jgi:hypothetical protein